MHLYLWLIMLLHFFNLDNITMAWNCTKLLSFCKKLKPFLTFRLGVHYVNLYFKSFTDFKMTAPGLKWNAFYWRPDKTQIIEYFHLAWFYSSSRKDNNMEKTVALQICDHRNKLGTTHLWYPHKIGVE